MSLLKQVAVSLCAALLFSIRPVSAEVVPLEYQAKASYLHNFVQFVDWPDDVLAEAETFNVCVVGTWRFSGDALDGLEGERAEGRPLAIRRLPTAHAARGRVRFEVNQKAAERAGLIVSSRLLRPAMER